MDSVGFWTVWVFGLVGVLVYPRRGLHRQAPRLRASRPVCDRRACASLAVLPVSSTALVFYSITAAFMTTTTPHVPPRLLRLICTLRPSTRYHPPSRNASSLSSSSASSIPVTATWTLYHTWHRPTGLAPTRSCVYSITQYGVLCSTAPCRSTFYALLYTHTTARAPPV